MAGLLDEVRRAKRKATEEAGLLPDESLISADVAAEPVAETPVAPAAATPEPAPVRFSEAFATARQAGVPTFEWNGNEYTSQTAEEAAKQAAPAPAAAQTAPAPQIGGGSSNAPQAPLDVNALLSNPKAQDNTALRSPLDDLRVNAAQKSAAADQDMAARQRSGAAKPVSTISNSPQPEGNLTNALSGMATNTQVGLDKAKINAQAWMSDALDKTLGRPSTAEGEARKADLIRKYDQAQAAGDAAKPGFNLELTNDLYDAYTSLAQTAPSLALGVLTKNPALALGMAGAQAADYLKYKKRGASVAEASLGALGEGVTEIVTEKMPMGMIVDKLGKMGAGEFLAGFLVREWGGEQVATAVQDALDTAIANPDKTWGQYLAERPEAIYQTTLAVLVTGGAVGAANTLAQAPAKMLDAHEARQATQAADQAKNKALSDWNNTFKPQPRPAPGTIVPHLGNVDERAGDAETDSLLDASIAAAIQAQSPIPEQDIPGMQEPTMDPNAPMQEAPGGPVEPTLTEQAPPAQQASDLVHNTPWFTNPEQPAAVNTPAPEQPTPQPLAESQAPAPSEPGDVGVAPDVAADPSPQAAPQVEAPAAYTEPAAAPAPRSEYANSHPAQQELDGIAGKYAARAASIVTAKPDIGQRSPAEQDIVDEAARLADITVVDPSTLSDTPAQGQLGRGEFELLTKLGELTGQNFVLVHAPSMKAEQFVAPGTSRNVYIDTSKPFSISPLATAGHETTHIALHTLRNSADPEDQAIAETVDQAVRDNLKGKDLAAYNRYSGQGHLPVPGQREEAAADMGGNLHTSPAFYTKVLEAVEKKHGTSGVRKFIASVKNAIAKLTALVNGRTYMEHYYDGKGNEVPFVKNAAMVRDALEQALVRYYVNHGNAASMAKTKAAMALGSKQSAKPAAVKRSEPRVVEAEENRTYKLDLAREARTQNKISRLSTEEVAAIAGAAEKMGLTPPAMRKLLEQARATKNQFPVTDGWSPLTVTGLTQKKDDDGAPIPGTEKVSWQVQPYGYHIPPGKTRAPVKTDEAWQKKVADQFEQLVLDIYNRAEQGDKNAQVIIGHQTWYRNVAEVLRREYGGFGDLLADLLGATSPNTPVDTNWRFSVEILRRFVRGDFDAEMAKFDKYVAEGKPLAKYPRADKITQVSGKLYGMNSVNSMKALLDMWRVIETGQAPKARNFALNLIGQSKMATIDVWAARMLRRAANQVRGANLPRIPVPAEAGVDGVWNASKTKVTGAYGFGAEVMQIVSDRLQAQGKNITPPDLQAIAWFAEKELWGSKGWTSVQGEGGSFEERIEGTPVDRFLAGFSIQQGEKKPEPEAVSLAQARVLTMLTGDDSVLAARVLPTKGLYAGTVEESFDAEWVATRGQHNPALAMAEIARVAGENGQYDFFVSRVIGPNEDNANARPGVELYFKDKHSLQAAMPVLDAFTSRGQDGFTLVVDPRAQTKQGEFIGVRLQYVPEISIRWDEGLRAQLVAPGGLEKVLQEKTDTLLAMVDTVARMDGVAFAARHNYDTVVVGKENYDAYINRAAGKGDPRTGGEGWFGQPIRQAVEGAAARLEGEQRAVDAGRVPAADSLVPADVKQSLPRDGSGRRASGSTAAGEVPAPERTAPQEALAGAPRVKGFTGPDPRLVSVAEQYARDNGIDLKRQSEYVQVDEDRARRIAQAYEAMPHAPQDPVVKEAFQNLIRQTTAQYQALVDGGYRFWFTDLSLPNNVEYLSTPWNAMRELRADQVMGVFPTDEGFGTSDFDPANNPLLADTGFTWPVGSIHNPPTRRVLANDLFRAVHDAFGHGLEGAGFRAQGEENAWQAHVRLFTGSALGAITTETRGQNSWLNYGPHGEANQTAAVEDTVFADQKTGLMPEWTWTEGLAGDMKHSAPRQVDTPEFKNQSAWIALEPTQIKSAIGNNGDFDGANPDIRRSMPRRNDYQMASVEGDPKKGPVFYGDDFVLEALNPVDTTDEYSPNGMVAHGAMGHLGHVTEGATPYLFRILDTNGKRVGDLMADVKAGVIVAIHDFETYSKRAGLGSNIVAHIAASAPGPVRVIDIIKQSRPFWAKFGADYYDPYNNSSLDWSGARQYLAQRQEPGASPGAADADLTTSPGSTGIAVGEVSAEEAAKYKFSLPRPDAARSGSVREGADEAGYGTPIANSVQVKGVHYSAAPRAVLDSSKHGTGMPGAESRRLQDWSATPEQRKRVYFYVDEGTGVRPESGVGHVAHSVSLNNLYDLKADPLNLWWKALGKGGSQNDSGNYVEQEVMAAGFDGVYMPAVINDQGVAVLLGEHQVEIKKSGPRDNKTAAERRANFAAMIGREDEAQRNYVDDAMAEAEKDWEAAKRGVVPHATTEDAAHALAERLGWSAEATQDALKRGNVAIGGGKSVPAADLLGAAAATSRLAIANLLANPGAADFSQKMAEAINLMIATRANLSEIGRALSYAGWMQRTPGKDAVQRHSDAVEALKQATTAAGNAVGITANMSVDEKQIVSEYNEAMRDLGDARMGLEEANLDTQEATQELRGAWQQVKDARGARDAAKKQLSEANAELRDAEKKRDGAVDRTPSGLTITTAEGLARRAEKEAAKAKKWEQIVKDRIKAAKERLKRAQDQLQRAKDNAADPAELADLEQRADLAAKEAAKATASMQEAQRKLREAENRLKAAQEKEARLKAAMPTAHDISQAQGKARRAEQAADKAVADLREAKRELAKLRAKMRAAEKRAIDAANRLLGIQAQVAQMKEPQFIGKGGVSMAEIEAAVGGKKGMERIQRAMRAQGANLDLGQVAQFFQGIANSIYNQKLEKTKHAGARGRIHNFLASWLELFRASILTGIFTHGTNILSNAVFQSVEMLVTRPIAAALPGGAGAGRHYKALAGALMHSVADVVAILRFGMTQEFPAAHFESLAAARPGTRQDLLNLGGNKWMDHAGGALPGIFGKGARTVGFAPLGAMDLLFKVVPYRYSIAMQQASGKPVDYAQAIEMAEYQTFQTKLSEAVSALPRAVAAFPLAGFIVPFIKTLVNLINRTVDYTPVIGQYRNLDNLMGTHGADARNVALAQGVVGLGLAMIVVALHGDGDDDEESLLSGMGPIDYNKQAIWAANNEKLGLRIGDWVVPLWRVEPFASMMGLTIAASDAYRMYQDDGDVAAGGQAVAAALGQVVIGKSFMKGAEEALQAVLDLEGRGWKYVTERLPQSVVLGTLIPNFIPQLGDMTDEYKREAEGWSEQIKRRLPGVREELDAKMDWKGAPIPEPRFGTVLPLQRMPVKRDNAAAWALRNDVPLEATPRTLKKNEETGKEIPYAERQRLLKMRALEMSLAAQSTGVAAGKPPANETPEEKAGRLAMRKILKEDAQIEGRAVKSDWSKEVSDMREVYGLDSIE